MCMQLCGLSHLTKIGGKLVDPLHLPSFGTHCDTEIVSYRQDIQLYTKLSILPNIVD